MCTCTFQKLQNYKPLSEYNIIKKLIQHNQYGTSLFKMGSVADNKVQIYIYKIKNKGMNSFERRILESYNSVEKKL